MAVGDPLAGDGDQQPDECADGDQPAGVAPAVGILFENAESLIVMDQQFSAERGSDVTYMQC